MTSLSSLSKAKICCAVTLLFSVVDLIHMTIQDGFTVDLVPACVAVVLISFVQFFIRKTQRSLAQASKTLKHLAKGDFSARILNISEKGDVGHVLCNINDMTDVMDAFVRESTACMQAVNENRYYRKIVPDGLHGDLLYGSQTINKALANVGKKMADFSHIAHDVDTSLQSVAGDITTTIETLNQTSRDMEVSVQGARTKSETAVRGANNTSLSVDTISSASEQMSASISEISQQVSRTSQISSEAVESAEDAKIRMAELKETVKKISDVVKLIEDIANQTNLLALNATIEAARAGEAGKGFAVVAGEVKTLAAQTTEATDNIRKQIGAIQDATESSAHSFVTISDIIHKMNSYTANIAAAIEEQSAASKEISNSSHRAAEETGQVSNNIEDLERDIAIVNQSADGVAQITETLSGKTAANVNELVTKMNNFMRELNKVV